MQTGNLAASSIKMNRSTVPGLEAPLLVGRRTRGSIMRGFDLSALAVGLVVTMAVSTPPGTALAQGGSTGGTVGKQGKSISGEDDKPRRASPERRPESRPRASTAPRENAGGCGRSPVGSWSWSAGMGTITVSFRSDGTASTSNAFTGKWACSDGMYSVTWHTGSIDRFRVASDGRTLSGTAAVMNLTISGSRQ
jgi:hypothetical protein